MSVQSVTAASNPSSSAGAEPPSLPALSPSQQGDLAAGRIRVAEGRVFDGVSPEAPPTARWGEQPAGTAYRSAYESAAARIGSRDPAQVGAELDRQLYGNAAPPAAAPARSSEGFGSFVEGAVMGDFGNNSSWSATAGQVGVGFVPIVGQIADARDTIASAGQVLRGEEGGWLNLGASLIGWVPGVGDAAKAAIRGGERAVDAGTEVVQGAARQSDEVAQAATRPEIVMNGGTRGAWPRELNARNLQPNTDYVVNGYRYATDANGRVGSVEGRLDLQTAQRNGYQQSVSGREDRLPDDQGGHLIASIFNGPGDRLNLVPMNGNFNMGAWRAMENRFADALQEGRQVDVRVEVRYSGDTGRPDGFVVTSRVDGGRPVRDVFLNRPGGQ